MGADNDVDVEAVACALMESTVSLAVVPVLLVATVAGEILEETAELDFVIIDGARPNPSLASAIRKNGLVLPGTVYS